VLHRSGQWDVAWAHYRAVGGFPFAQQATQDRAA